LRRKSLPPPDYDSSAFTSQEAASRFALADLDGDGQLSKHEFESELQYVNVSIALLTRIVMLQDL
jgi:Ca2+-binding EF-hand superfamily protein